MKRKKPRSAKAARKAAGPLPLPSHGPPSGSKKSPAAAQAPAESIPLGLALGDKVQPKPALAFPAILLEGDAPPSAPSAGPGPKYAVRPAPQDAPLQPERGELPQAYGTGRLFLAARDPRSLYAHWDLDPEQQKRYNDLSVHGHLTVRVRRDGLPGPLVSEVHVHPESRHGFIPLDAAPGKYVAELGYYPPNGPWTMVAASEPAVTPGAATAEDQPVRFATLPAEAEPSAPLPTMVSTVVSRSAGPQPVYSPYASRKPFPIPLLIAPEPTAFEPAFLALPPVLLSGDEFPVPAPVPEWTRAQEYALAELIAQSYIRHEPIGSLEIEELIRGQFQRVGVSPPSEVPGVPGAEQAAISSAALGEAPAPAPGFWFNVNAELVIYGATTPEAMVTIGGRPIRLRSDGTFSYRFALPDGAYHLPVTAASPQGDVRRAELDFYRGTSYSGEVGAHPQDPGLSAPLADNVS
jgi:hypothetical protein